MRPRSIGSYNEAMSARWETSANTLVTDLKRVFGGRLLSVAVYGPEEESPRALTCLVIVASLTQDDLEACARLAGAWARLGIDTPLILPDEEFRRSLDTFPLEYADMIATRVHVFGRDPFEKIVIDAEDLRRACEKQVKSHLLHLREGYIQAHGNPLAVNHLVVESASAFAALLRNVARFIGATAPTRAEAALAGAHAVRLDDATVRQVLSLAGSAAKTVDGARLFPGYLAAVEQLAHAVDTWRP